MKNSIKAIVAVGAFALTFPSLAEVVVVVNPANGATSMKKDEVAQYFLGKSTVLMAVDQPEATAIHTEFYKKVADKDPSQLKSLWSKLVFTGKAMPPMEAADSAAVKKMVAANPKAIGYIERSAVDATVKVVLTAP
ncbi:hypothetical protein [Massilia sp.]|uniref:hypothetical protein n=1 Tax=Massilia sp. TaxID=1882437 RepID=UPI00352E6236